jgi:hypothetical protein
MLVLLRVLPLLWSAGVALSPSVFFSGTLCIFDMNFFFPQHLLDLFFFLLPSYYL